MEINFTKSYVAPFSRFGRRSALPLCNAGMRGISPHNAPHPLPLPERERGAQRGSVVITIVLFMIILMTSTAIVLSGTLSRHIRASQDYLSSEKAFAAANTGIEEMLYQLRKQDNNEPSVESDITYSDDTKVLYKGKGIGVAGDTGVTPCITSAGTYGTLVRRIVLGGGSQGCDL